MRQPVTLADSFFNRLVGFVRQHLPRKAHSAEGVSSPNDGEGLTIALLDSITIHWLLSIDSRLVSIIRTEFATELKTKRICEMVKPIAQNIDDLLLRYENKEQINSVSAKSTPKTMLTDFDEEKSPAIQALITRIERLEGPYRKQQNRKFYQKNRGRKQEQCSHCLFLNKQLGSNLRTDHSSYKCGKNKVSVSLLESLDTDPDEAVHADDLTSESAEGALINTL